MPPEQHGCNFGMHSIGFHLICAGVMGLNDFIWALAATYPAIIYVALH